MRWDLGRARNAELEPTTAEKVALPIRHVKPACLVGAASLQSEGNPHPVLVFPVNLESTIVTQAEYHALSALLATIMTRWRAIPQVRANTAQEVKMVEIRLPR